MNTSFYFHKETNGGKILLEVIELLKDKRENGFKIMTLLKGIGFDIDSLTKVNNLDYHICNDMVHFYYGFNYKEVSYYQKQLNSIDINGEYPPSIIVYDGQGGSTKQLSLNKESAKDLIQWLKNNFILKY